MEFVQNFSNVGFFLPSRAGYHHYNFETDERFGCKLQGYSKD